MTTYFLIVVTVWAFTSSTGELITHTDAKKIAVFQSREQCTAARDAVLSGLEHGQESFCIEYRQKGAPL